MSDALSWVGENVFGQEKAQKSDPGGAYKVDNSQYDYGGGQWEDTGEQEQMLTPWGTPMTDAQGKPIMQPKKVWRSGADKASAKYDAISAQNRGGADADYLKADEDRQRALQARGMQGEAASLMMARARGDVPSISEMQAQRDSQRLAAEQSSIAAGARGPAALALAQQNQANASATGQSAISAQAQISAAQERQAAEQAAFGAASGMRQGDYQSQGLQSQQAGQKQQIGLGYSQLEKGVRDSQLTAAQNREAAKSGAATNAQALNNQATGQNNQGNMAIASGLIGGGTSVAGKFLSDRRAKRGISPLDASDFIGPSEPERVQEPPEAHQYEPGQSAYEDAYNATKAHLARGGVASTWGNAAPAVEEQQLAVDQAGKRAEQVAAMNKQAEAYVDPYQRDVDHAKAVRGAGLSLSPEEAAAAKRGKFMMREQERRKLAGKQDAAPPDDAEEKDAVAEGKALPKKGAPPPETTKDRAAAALGGLGDQFLKMGGAAAQNIGPGHVALVQPQMLQMPSDERAKTGISDIGGLGVMGSGYGAQGNDAASAVLNGGGMDVMGTLQKYADVSGAMNQSGGMSGVVSDMGAKSPLSSADFIRSDERAKDFRVALLDEPAGTERHWDRDVAKSDKPDAISGASLSGPAPKYSKAAPLAKAKGAPPKERKPTLDEASRWADAELAKTREATARDAGPSVRDDQAPPAWLKSYMGEQAPMYSDDRTKLLAAETKAYNLGRAHQMEQGKTGQEVPYTYQKSDTVTDKTRDQAAVENAQRGVMAAARSPMLKKAGGGDEPRAPRSADVSGGAKSLDVHVDSAPMKDADPARTKLLAARAAARAENDARLEAIRQNGGMQEREPSRIDRAADWVDRHTLAPAADALGSAYDWSTNLLSDERAKRVEDQTSPMQGAARAMRASVYAYKPEFRPPEQAPGEKNVGPMAQNMERNPVTATAVRKDPDTGLLSLDRDKLLKVLAGTSSAQQEQIDDLKRRLAKRGVR